MDGIFLTRGQFAVFGWCLLAGLAAGACYSLSRALRALLGAGRAATVLADAAWGLGAAAIAAAAGLHWAGGEVRLYWLAGFAAGCAVYLLTAHKFLAKCARKGYTVCKPKWDAYRARFRQPEEQACRISQSTPSARRRSRPGPNGKRSKKKKPTSAS